MKTKISEVGQLLKSTFQGWMKRDPFKESAIIAYYSIFSLPSLLVIIINVIGFFFAKDVISTEISRQIESAMGQDAAKEIAGIVNNANQAKAGLIPGIVAAVTLLIGATGVFVQLQTVLNNIWGVRQNTTGGIMQTVKNRIFSFGLILSIGFLLLVSLAVSSILASISHWLKSTISPGIATMMYAIEFVISLGVISVLFGLMFKFLPDVKIVWKNVWAGALMTGFLFMLGKYGLSLYFGKANPGSVYGAAGSIVLVLLWVSYSSMIVFFGAEFTKQYALSRGAAIEVTRDAEIIEHNIARTLIPEEHVPAHQSTTFKTVKSEQELERKLDKRSLHLAIKGRQIKEQIIDIFKQRKNQGPREENQAK